LSQRLTFEELSCRGETGVESCRCSGNALGWTSACGAKGASGPVSGSDRSRCHQRKGCGRGGCVAEHLCPWFRKGGGMRLSTLAPGVRALSVLHRAREIAVLLASALGCERSPVGSVAPHRHLPKLQRNAAIDAAALNIEPRPPTGMLSVALNDPSRPSSRSTRAAGYVQDRLSGAVQRPDGSVAVRYRMARAASGTAQGPPLGTVLEPGADLRPPPPGLPR